MRARILLAASALAAAGLLGGAGAAAAAAEPAPPTSHLNGLANSTCDSATNAAALLGGSISCGQ
ncbi:hypothetical protein MMF93_19535 [Streptomyces tubbatahanensis]|uniref:Chaplin domain-containing protein n=1 Tax=Streptomyces tubbatahanensis TaxID=2923272 RepID=A0ABY3XV79_9ACTN|nr:hypothetical protein [Streptomyces tubbatahanensis]UNS98396.1 hypothetical protein MMF93_19535 [Streptomyces tubbatahanensis]